MRNTLAWPSLVRSFGRAGSLPRHCRIHEHAELSAPPRGACGASALGRSQQREVPAAWLVTLLRSATSICAGATKSPDCAASRSDEGAATISCDYQRASAKSGRSCFGVRDWAVGA
jgi:hypothetical protein